VKAKGFQDRMTGMFGPHGAYFLSTGRV